MPQAPGSNFYINNFNQSGEQALIESLVIESIKFYGMDLYYLKRTESGYDPIYTEKALTEYNSAVPTVMYIKNVDGFAGEGDFVSKFGIEIRDALTLSVALE